MQVELMRALILDGIEKIRFAETKTPNCNSREVLLKVDYCSICRTDVKMWSQSQRDLVLPRILGHEICGHLLDSDEHYVVWPANVCGECFYCKNGVENLCVDIEVLGFHRDGGLAQYVRVPKESLIKISKKTPLEVACMTELLSAAVNAVEQIDLQKKQKVLIFGGGPAGLMLGLACKHFGADLVIFEKNSKKVEKVAQFCKKTNIRIVSDAVVLDKFETVINASSDPELLGDGLLRLNAGGKFCIFSGFTKSVNFSSDLLNEVHYRQLTLIGAYGSTKKQMEMALKILEQNTKNLKLLIHKIIPLENVPEVLPKILHQQTLKYVVNPH